jgi:hypothetical protein
MGEIWDDVKAPVETGMEKEMSLCVIEVVKVSSLRLFFDSRCFCKKADYVEGIKNTIRRRLVSCYESWKAGWL